MSKRAHRVQDTAAYLLHTTAWRETSLIVQVFSRQYGNIALVAKGAKRPYSVLRPMLSAFQPLGLSWSGAGEVKTLTRAECVGIRPLPGRSYMSAWYMNELLLRVLPPEDPYPGLYDAYDAALQQLAGMQTSQGPQAMPQSVAGALRRFEWVLLEETGYGTGEPAPDFTDYSAEPELRHSLRGRLNELLTRPLQTRKVLMALQRY